MISLASMRALKFIKVLYSAKKIIFFVYSIKQMVSSIGFQLHSRKPISGFGARRCAPRRCGSGVVRRVLSTVARPALGFIANKIADLISGQGRRRRAAPRRRVTRGTSYRLTGSGRRAPRRRLGVRRTVRRSGCGARRAPRKTLGVRRRRR